MADPVQHPSSLAETLRARANLRGPEIHGRITKARGNLILATMDEARIGEECQLRDPVAGTSMAAEIVGFEEGQAILAPNGPIRGLSSQAFVVASGEMPRGPSGEAMLGRVVDAFGHALDDGPAIPADGPIHRAPPPPLSRPIIDTALETGIRALDGPLTLARGQRVGIFGAAGVGKSALLAQIIRQAKVDRIVLGLIGERGREVREFLDRDLGPDGLARASVVVATSDSPATERLRAAYTATAAAEAYRDAGHSVLLLIDSATRVARALREIGLATGEAPVRRGFPPSTFAALPPLVERAGLSESGSITAIYTVLVEGDDDDADPIADELRSLLDGHIILSRKLAAQGHFPAIDVMRSKSRVMDAVVTSDHAMAARGVVSDLTKLDEIGFLVQVGEYKPGADAAADGALVRRDKITSFLCQPRDEASGFDATVAALKAVSGAKG